MSYGATVNLEDSSFGSLRNWMIYAPKMVNAPGEAMDNTWIMLQLARG